MKKILALGAVLVGLFLIVSTVSAETKEIETCYDTVEVTYETVTKTIGTRWPMTFTYQKPVFNYVEVCEIFTYEIPEAPVFPTPPAFPTPPPFPEFPAFPEL